MQANNSDSGGDIGDATPPTSDLKKPKRQCLRPDCAHIRIVFITTFYRIWMYRKRHVLTTLLQILVPPFILIGMTAYLGSTLQLEHKPWSHYDPLDESQLIKEICGKCDATHKGVIAYYMRHQNSLFSKSFGNELRAILSQANVDLVLVKKKDDLVRKAVQHYLKGQDRFIAGIEVDDPKDVPNTPVGIGKKLKLEYLVSMAHSVPGFVFQHAPVFFDLSKNDPKLYYQLLGIELAVCRAFYKLVKKTTKPSSKPISLQVQSMSYPPHDAYTLKGNYSEAISIEDSDGGVYDGVDTMLATIFVLSMVPVFFTVIEAPVMEKENGLKLYLQIMGFPRGAYWFHWILNQMLIQLIVLVMQVALIFETVDPNTGPLVKYGNPSLWLFVLFLYNIASLSFFTFFASFCRRGKVATYIAILLWLISFEMLHTHIFDLGSGFNSFMLSCMIPSGCIYWAVYILSTVNSATWETVFNVSLTQKSGFQLADVILMLVLNFFVYFILTLYIDNVFPGPNELGQPWNYFFESCRCRFIDPNKESLKESTPSGTDIRRRRKKHGDLSRRSISNFPIVDVQKLCMHGSIENVNFKLYPGTITVLAGHKDSGKTTILRIMSGAYAPSSGTVMFYNGTYNVRKDTQKVQSFLSVCMANNIMLCDYLTVREHMLFIAKLKGVSTKDAKDDAKNILESLGLLSQQDDKPWRLAKWQLRVLCVAMALIGEAPILLLDDPTQGLELDAKRQIWSLLKELKQEGKTVLISTPSIEEAYQVGDKIVLMTRGRVAGVGAPSKLENILETGYHLYLEKIPDAKSEEILTFLREHVPSVKEREGGLKRTKKAIEMENWEGQSQGAIFSLDKRRNRSKTVINMQQHEHGHTSETTSSPAPSKQASDTFSRLSDLISMFRPTRPSRIPSISVSTEKNEEPAESSCVEVAYVLPNDEKANFPALFSALDDGNVALKLGIKTYEMKWHSIETAFDEIDDYVDLLDATDSSSQNLTLKEFGENQTSQLKKLIEDDDAYGPMPEHKQNHERSCRAWWTGMLAIVLKRIYHMIGNYRHGLCQALAPIIILLITIKATDVHFSSPLVSPGVAYNTSTKLSSPRVPYRIDPKGKEAKKFFKTYQAELEKPPNFITGFGNLGREEFSDYYNEHFLYKLHDEVVVAADFTQIKDEPSNLRIVKALYSPAQHHSGPLSLLLMFNTILKYEFPNHDYSVSMTGQSMLHRKQLSNLTSLDFPNVIIASGVDITLTVALALGYFIFASGFVTQPCSERLCKLKRYQMYHLKWNGLYWISTALVDATFNIFLTVFMTLIIYYCPAHDVFKCSEFTMLFVLTGTVGGFASILASYCGSHYWLKKATAYYAMLSVNQFFGLFLFLLYTIINFDSLGDYADSVAAFCLSIIQAFTIPWNFHAAILYAIHGGRCKALNKIIKDELCASHPPERYLINLKEKCCSPVKYCGISFIVNESQWAATPIWSNLVCLVGHCVGGILLLMFIESRRIRKNLLIVIFKPDKPPAIINLKNLKSIKNEEAFVKEEVPAMDSKARSGILLVENLSTSSGKRIILQPMTFAALPGHCTVIAGPETSGITVLYEVLAGLRAVSEGHVSYGGNFLFSWGTRKKFLQQLGLSPSQDICLDKLTGYQMLSLFGRLRGIPQKELSHHVDYWVQRLGMQTKINKNCAVYSPVYKKKLTIACTVIGNPPVCIFDEPTKNLDPLSRKQVCQILLSLICDNRVVVILTHDLASVQHLCTKLIILVNGQMQLCEKIEAIDEDIAEEFTLTVKLKSNDDTGRIDIKTFASFVSHLEEEIDSLTLQDEQSHTLMYRIKSVKYDWKSLFENVEKVVSQHPTVVLDYNIRKTSLVDVYNTYAAKQRVYRATDSAWDEFRTTYC